MPPMEAGDSAFPPLRNDAILRAARGEPVPRVPIWIMRQAGRYLPEFRETRSKHSFFEICQTPELACEVTLQPLRRFDLDAAIIFSDILVVPQALGLDVKMVEGKGPVLEQPLVEPKDLDRLTKNPDVGKCLKYVMDAIRLTRHRLEGRVPLFGFAGAPWTLMAYMVEGGGSSTHAKSKSWFYNWPEASEALLDTVADVVAEFLCQQAAAGAQLLQLFESHCGALTPELFTRFELPRLRRILRTVRERCPDVPVVVFAKDGHFAFDQLVECGFDVVSLDWTMSPELCRRRAGDRVSLQGNLDPVLMCGPTQCIEPAVRATLDAFGCRRYICNLGHGIYPDAKVENVAELVRCVHRLSEQMLKK